MLRTGTYVSNTSWLNVSNLMIFRLHWNIRNFTDALIFILRFSYVQGIGLLNEIDKVEKLRKKVDEISITVATVGDSRTGKSEMSEKMEEVLSMKGAN